MIRRLRAMMRKGLILAMLLAIVSMPMAFGGVGLCRSMPCCPPHPSTHLSPVDNPICGNTANCDQPPAAAGEFTTAKQIPGQHVVLVPVVIVPTTLTIGRSLATWEASPPIAPPALQRRIAILSTLLI